jgi:phosphatidylcholine synthase
MVPSAAEPGPPAAFAWLVHMFTATSAPLALLSLVAVEARQWRLALLWLFVALVVDGIDGTLARWARVKEKAARIDGDAMDLVVDYLTYVFVPALFIWRAGLVPKPLGLWLAAAILISSLYIFARTDMKTADGYFRGFPALWNLVAFYLFVTEASPAVGAIAVALLVIMTFAPVHFVHPFRVQDYGRWLPILAIAWAAATCALLWQGWDGSVRAVLLIVSLSAASVLVALGLLRSVRGERARPVSQG